MSAALYAETWKANRTSINKNQTAPVCPLSCKPHMSMYIACVCGIPAARPKSLPKAEKAEVNNNSLRQGFGY